MGEKTAQNRKARKSWSRLMPKDGHIISYVHTINYYRNSIIELMAQAENK